MTQAVDRPNLMERLSAMRAETAEKKPNLLDRLREKSRLPDEPPPEPPSFMDKAKSAIGTAAWIMSHEGLGGAERWAQHNQDLYTGVARAVAPKGPIEEFLVGIMGTGQSRFGQQAGGLLQLGATAAEKMTPHIPDEANPVAKFVRRFGEEMEIAYGGAAESEPAPETTAGVFTRALGEVGIQIGLQLASGGTLGGAGLLGRVVAFSGGALGPVMGAQYIDAKENGRTNDEAAVESLAAGLITFGTNLPVGGVLMRIPGVARHAATAAKKQAKAMIAAGGRIAGGAVAEGLQEGSEKFLTDAFASAYREDPSIFQPGTLEYLKELGFEAAVGAAAGGGVATGLQVAGQSSRPDVDVSPAATDLVKRDRDAAKEILKRADDTGQIPSRRELQAVGLRLRRASERGAFVEQLRAALKKRGGERDASGRFKPKKATAEEVAATPEAKAAPPKPVAKKKATKREVTPEYREALEDVRASKQGQRQLRGKLEQRKRQAKREEGEGFARELARDEQAEAVGKVVIDEPKGAVSGERLGVTLPAPEIPMDKVRAHPAWGETKAQIRKRIRDLGLDAKLERLIPTGKRNIKAGDRAQIIRAAIRKEASTPAKGVPVAPAPAPTPTKPVEKVPVAKAEVKKAVAKKKKAAKKAKAKKKTVKAPASEPTQKEINEFAQSLPSVPSAMRHRDTGEVYVAKDKSQTHTDVLLKIVPKDVRVATRDADANPIEAGYVTPDGDFITIDEYRTGAKGVFQSSGGADATLVRKTLMEQGQPKPVAKKKVVKKAAVKKKAVKKKTPSTKPKPGKVAAPSRAEATIVLPNGEKFTGKDEDDAWLNAYKASGSNLSFGDWRVLAPVTMSAASTTAKADKPAAKKKTVKKTLAKKLAKKAPAKPKPKPDSRVTTAYLDESDPNPGTDGTYEPGYYSWWDSEPPHGPFETEEEAKQDALEAMARAELRDEYEKADTDLPFDDWRDLRRDELQMEAEAREALGEKTPRFGIGDQVALTEGGNVGTVVDVVQDDAFDLEALEGGVTTGEVETVTPPRILTVELPDGSRISIDERDALDPRLAAQPTPIPEGGEGRTVVRFTDASGRGLMNNDALDRSKLTDEEEFELAELMDLGLQQPRDVPSDATFAFTEEGEAQHARLIELLTKAAKNDVVRTEHQITGEAVWETSDGQVAFTTDQIAQPIPEGESATEAKPEKELSAIERAVLDARAKAGKPAAPTEPTAPAPPPVSIEGAKVRIGKGQAIWTLESVSDEGNAEVNTVNKAGRRQRRVVPVDSVTVVAEEAKPEPKKPKAKAVKVPPSRPTKSRAQVISESEFNKTVFVHRPRFHETTAIPPKELEKTVESIRREGLKRGTDPVLGRRVKDAEARSRTSSGSRVPFVLFRAKPHHEAGGEVAFGESVPKSQILAIVTPRQGQSLYEAYVESTAPKVGPKVGDKQKVMDVDSVVADVRTIDGVRYELYDDDGKGIGGTFRVVDIESGNVVGSKRFPKVADAEAEFDKAIKGTIGKAKKAKPRNLLDDLLAEGEPIETMGATAGPDAEVGPSGQIRPRVRSAADLMPKKMKGKKPSKQSPHAFQNEESEAEWRQSNRGITPTDTFTKLAQFWNSIVKITTRGSKPELERRAFGGARAAVDKYRRAAGNAAWDAGHLLKRITRHLSNDDYDLFTRVVVLRDLSETDGNLPFRLTPETVAEELARAEQKLLENDEVSAALEYRDLVWNAIKEDYIKSHKAIDIDETKKFRRQNYFRHQILYHMRLQQDRGTKVGGRPTGRAEYKKGESHFRERKGSTLPINTNYVQAEYEVMTKLIAARYRAEALADFKAESIYEELRAEAKEKGVDWRELMPATHSEYQLRQGNVIFPAQTINQAIADKLLAEVGTSLGITSEDLRKVAAIGKAHKPIVVRNEIVAQLEEIDARIEKGMGRYVDAMITVPMRWWKRWALQSPWRVVGYNLRNSTEVDKVMFLNPSAIKMIPRAAKELWAYYRDHDDISPDVLDWAKRGENSLVLVNEIADVDKLKQFDSLARRLEKKTVAQKAAGAPVEAWRLYWDKIGAMTNYREAILRYAGYLDYMKQMDRNSDGMPDNYGASVREEVQGIPDQKDRAHRLSADLLGDYSDISVLGQFIRARVFPFWSFQEVNWRAYLHGVQNIASHEPTAVKAGIAVAKRFGVHGAIIKTPFMVYKLGRLALLFYGFSAMLTVINRVLFPEDDDELPIDAKRRAHLTLGRDSDGRVRYFSRLGTAADTLEWVGMAGANVDFMDLIEGRKSFKDIVQEYADTRRILKAPVNKITGGLSPFVKTPAELALGKSAFPDVFEPRRIRDRGEHVARQFALHNEWRALMGRPNRGYLKEIKLFGTTKTDVNAAAYYTITDLKFRFKRKIGDSVGFGGEGARSDALFNYKRSIKFGDAASAKRYAVRYYELGGTDAGVKRSLKAMHPLAGLSKPKKIAFVASLDENERDLLYRADLYYRQVLLGQGQNN